ncbi:hypothetical protein [Pseudobacteriovorax antillogorgiicola]|uniref:Histidine kinase-, DNA gyrase B-, and HSP90-like ATPase n=1 Tax=Pseudobacteriovorax antillogorgiicola TaxID=1513793 RepID=A0A1Y6CPX3_9BACT|nr:hypothetical protein [Pseudobacteriovorax antillogorgiicola]TCS42725.1 hypothetical protein EDD56_14112 [Pseudobacteriovorax antillogorgiicola]SMF82430.1 hypothetical protein SAMN06296036_1418 [Pseudobacteriovorax antillogorgiicola]
MTFKAIYPRLDMPRLQEKGLAAELINPEQASEEEIANIIFASGISTEEQVSEISGRGVGLDAVASYIRSGGGDIQIRLEGTRHGPYQPFKFHLVIPLLVDDRSA